MFEKKKAKQMRKWNIDINKNWRSYEEEEQIEMKKQRKGSLKYTEETTTTLRRRRTVKVKVNNE